MKDTHPYKKSVFFSVFGTVPLLRESDLHLAAFNNNTNVIICLISNKNNRQRLLRVIFKLKIILIQFIQ